MNAEGKRLICENQRDLREIFNPADCADERRRKKIDLRKPAISAGDSFACRLPRSAQKGKRLISEICGRFLIPRIAQMSAEHISEICGRSLSRGSKQKYNSHI